MRLRSARSNRVSSFIGAPRSTPRAISLGRCGSRSESPLCRSTGRPRESAGKGFRRWLRCGVGVGGVVTIPAAHGPVGNTASIGRRALVEVPLGGLDVNPLLGVEGEKTLFLPASYRLPRHTAGPGELGLAEEFRPAQFGHGALLPVTLLPGFTTLALGKLGAPTTRIGLEPPGALTVSTGRGVWHSSAWRRHGRWLWFTVSATISPRFWCRSHRGCLASCWALSARVG